MLNTCDSTTTISAPRSSRDVAGWRQVRFATIVLLGWSSILLHPVSSFLPCHPKSLAGINLSLMKSNSNPERIGGIPSTRQKWIASSGATTTTTKLNAAAASSSSSSSLQGLVDDIVQNSNIGGKRQTIFVGGKGGVGKVRYGKGSE